MPRRDPDRRTDPVSPAGAMGGTCPTQRDAAGRLMLHPGVAAWWQDLQRPCVFRDRSRTPAGGDRPNIRAVMRPPPRPPRWPSALILPLALWSAVPRLEWCPIGWAEVRPDCFAACAGDADPARCEAGRAQPPCDPGCTPSVRAAEPPSPLDSAPADAYPGGRAYCLGGPSGGDGLLPFTPDAPNASEFVAVLPPAAPAPAILTLRTRLVIAEALYPRPSPVGAVPRVRAPPSISRNNC